MSQILAKLTGSEYGFTATTVKNARMNVLIPAGLVVNYTLYDMGGRKAYYWGLTKLELPRFHEVGT